MPDTTESPPQFEEALAELDGILRELEDGTTTLEDALSRYERGVALLRQCYGQLRDAEQRVNDRLRVPEEQTRYQIFVMCMPAMPAVPR